MSAAGEQRREGRTGALRSGWHYAALGKLAGLLLDALMATTRIEALNTEAYRSHQRQGQPVIFAVWHGRLLPPTYRQRNEGLATLASRSGDGEYITRILHHWGFQVVRGSSSRGGEAALRELIRLVKGGRSVAITPDGPRGPRERIKHGVLQIAQLTGAPLIPVVAAASSAWWFESWDRFLIPRPFARVRVMYGDAVFIPRKTAAGDLAPYAEDLEARLAELTQRVEAPFA
ncbi:hypothetical protein BH23GEM9_BH23GEM9_04850 [soil metagenome]